MDPNSDISINSPEWDYTQHASSYSSRPNYAPTAIDKLVAQVGADSDGFVAADVGAGTGNLTVMLLERGVTCIAIEPNSAMRKIGIESTQNQKVEWRIGKGEETTLDNSSVNLFAMGSSFNTTERQATLKEAARVLKPNGYFACMWNHRELEKDPVQKKVEQIIREFVPDYSHGTRREDQKDVIVSTGDFNEVSYIEESQKVQRSLDQYLDAWKSVRNNYWDVNTPEGGALFEKIVQRIKDEFSSLPHLELMYTTRIWVARKK